jgi:hypothetical protein
LNVHPRKLKLSLLRFIILDFCLDIFSPLTFRKNFNLGKYSFIIFVSVGENITISSAYLTLQHPFKALYSFEFLFLGILGLINSSIPFKHKLHNIGDITPP